MTMSPLLEERLAVIESLTEALEAADAAGLSLKSPDLTAALMRWRDEVRIAIDILSSSESGA
jgi:hypothetical protein